MYIKFQLLNFHQNARTLNGTTCQSPAETFINGTGGTFDKKPNYICIVIPKKLK